MYYNIYSKERGWHYVGEDRPCGYYHDFHVYGGLDYVCGRMGEHPHLPGACASNRRGTLYAVVIRPAEKKFSNTLDISAIMLYNKIVPKEGNRKKGEKKMYSKKFDDHKQAQACLNYYNDGSFALQSYNTIVATVSASGWVHVNGLYSRTTIKHLGWFARAIGTTYQTLKTLLCDNMDMNIYTGEVKEWAE